MGTFLAAMARKNDVLLQRTEYDISSADALEAELNTLAPGEAQIDFFSDQLLGRPNTPKSDRHRTQIQRGEQAPGVAEAAPQLRHQAARQYGRRIHTLRGKRALFLGSFEKDSYLFP